VEGQIQCGICTCLFCMCFVQVSCKLSVCTRVSHVCIPFVSACIAALNAVCVVSSSFLTWPCTVNVEEVVAVSSPLRTCKHTRCDGQRLHLGCGQWTTCVYHGTNTHERRHTHTHAHTYSHAQTYTHMHKHLYTHILIKHAGFHGHTTWSA
jgi:hypothetical protein